MPLWGNTDSANNEPHFPELREVVPTGSLVTSNAVLGGNKIWFTTNVPSTITAGMYVYGGDDSNNAISRVAKDGSFFDQNDIGIWRSNNSVSAVSGNTITLTNNVTAVYGPSKTVYFSTGLNRGATRPQSNTANDVILVTASRMANTQGTNGGGGSTVANTRLGNVNAGWNLIRRKINNDGTVRFLKETLVALANPVASNTQSANTSANAIYGGV
jgi:hypothetical protein